MKRARPAEAGRARRAVRGSPEGLTTARWLGQDRADTLAWRAQGPLRPVSPSTDQCSRHP